MSYTIMTGEGGELGTDESKRDALRYAASHAARLGEAVYVSGPGIETDPDDDTDIGIEVAPPTLRDYQTGDAIRPATAEELDESRAAGAEGVITVDGRSCYVEE